MLLSIGMIAGNGGAVTAQDVDAAVLLGALDSQITIELKG